MAIDSDINSALLEDVYAIYSQAEEEMLEKVAKRVAKGITAEGWNEQKLKETQELKKDIEKVIKDKCYKGQCLVSEDIVSAYTKGKISATIDAGTKAKRTSSIDMSGITSKKLKESIQTAFDFAKGMEGLPQDPDKMFKKVVYATGPMEARMVKTNAGAQVIGDTIYVCKPYQKYIDDEFIMHEIGHKVTKFGTKTTDASQKAAAEELAKKLGYSSVKSMSLYVSEYAAKNPTELYPEVLMEYYKSLKTGKPLMGNKKKVIEAVMEQMYNDPKKKKEIEASVMQFAKGIHTSVLDEFDIPMNLKQLILATNKLLNNASFQILRNAEDAYTKIMAHATTGLLSGTDTRIQASQKMLNEMSAKGITSFVDKAGRSWSLSSYAEMCARTVSSHAALQGHIDRQLEVGEDLVKVSSIGTTCPVCQRWQGVVLSISGKSPKYHSLGEAKSAGLFHPNCKHTLEMYIPELDDTEHEGKVEPDEYDPSTTSSKRYVLIQQQRSNERNIRYWKRRRATAITPDEQLKANDKVKYWQYKNMLHCEKNGLRRQYSREADLVGHSEGPTGTFIGGSLKEYKALYKDVIGEDPEKAYKYSKKVYGAKEVTFEKWLKDEITSLDELDVDKAMMKDASAKHVTPTSLYKKYIGDEPMKDWAAVSPYEKGTKEYKSGYAKWLKEQIEEIGVSYKVKPKYVEVHEDIPVEDTKLSATEIYKKYHGGEKPTDAFKKLGGEEGTGMKYGKWVETEKKKLIKEGITKTVPFDSSTMEKTRTVIKEAKKVVEEAEKFVEEPELVAYKEMLKKTKTEPKAISTEMKLISDKIKTATGFEKTLLEKKYEAVKEHDLDVLREKVKTAKLGSGAGDVDFEMKWLKEHVLDSKTIPDEVKAHVKKKYDIWAERKVELDKEEAEKKRKEAERLAKEEVKRRAIKMVKDIAEKISNEDIEAIMKKFTTIKDDDDEFRDEKIKALDEIIKERTKAAEDRRIAAEAAERRKKMLEDREKYLAEMGVLPRDTGASVLDGLTDYYDSTLRSSSKKKAQSTIDNIAKELSITSEQAKEELDNDLKAMFMECEYGARIKGSVLKLVLSDDPNISGFKNLFEVGTGGGCTNQHVRGNGEDNVFGYKESFSKNKLDRPFYGMLMPKYDEKSKKYYQSGPGSYYGDGITLIFNKALTNNISFTIGDSLDYDDYVTGCEASNPEFRGCHRMFESKYVEAKKSGVTSPSELLMRIADDSDRYLELQYHGHETKMSMVDYIDKVYIKRSRPDIEKLLDEKGIPYEIILK